MVTFHVAFVRRVISGSLVGQKRLGFGYSMKRTTHTCIHPHVPTTPVHTQHTGPVVPGTSKQQSNGRAMRLVGGRDGGNSGGGSPPSALCGVIQAGDLPALKRAIAADDRWVGRQGRCVTSLFTPCFSLLNLMIMRAHAHTYSAVNAPQGPLARTLLMEASVAGQAPCAALLLSQGAQVAKVKGRRRRTVRGKHTHPLA